MRARDFLAFWLVAMTAACTVYRPARFAWRPPVTDVHDDVPVPVPRWRWVPESVYLSEVYLHRPLRDALDLSAYPDADDVNAMDEVARSTWFVPRTADIGTMARGPETLGPPLAPFTVLPEPSMALGSGGFCIADSRGQKYEIAIDPADRPEMRTGATAIAARIIWALGYNTPPVFLIRARAEDFWRSEGSSTDVTALLHAGPLPALGYYRLAAISWPPGVLLGYAPESGVRGDDPNDTLPHENRRTLRALKVFASWLALDGLGPAKTVDRYVGAPNEGHVVHYIVGLDEALGAANIVRATDPPPAEGGGSPFTRLATLGLFPNLRRPPTQREMLALGEFPSDVDPSSFAPPLPYEPADRLLAPDGYWAAKRILALSSAHLALAIAAGGISDPKTQQAMAVALEARRRKVASYWLARVTPLELLSVVRTKVALRDEAVQNGLVAPNVTDYRVVFLNGDGEPVDVALALHPHGSVVEFALPERAIAPARDYLIVRVTARRNGRLLPRVFELHLNLTQPGGPAVVGVRH
jgi:hypothetical protein